MARIDGWTDPEVTAAVTALAAFSDWGGGAIGVGRVAQQAQLDAELNRFLAQIPTQGLAIIGSRVPFHVGTGIADGKIQQELQWRFRAP